jgi:hypothetical protein
MYVLELTHGNGHRQTLSIKSLRLCHTLSRLSFTSVLMGVDHTPALVAMLSYFHVDGCNKTTNLTSYLFIIHDVWELLCQEL